MKLSKVVCHEKSVYDQKKCARYLQSAIGRFTGPPYEYLSQLSAFTCIIRVVYKVFFHEKSVYDQKKCVSHLQSAMGRFTEPPYEFDYDQ